MLGDDFVDVFLVDIGIPGLARIHDEYRAFIAAVEASGAVDANLALATRQAELLDFFLGVFPDLGGFMIVAAAFAVLALIAAKEYMMRVIAHLGIPRCRCGKA